VITDYTNPRHKPLSWKQHLENERIEEERKRDEAERPIREAEAVLNKTHRKLFELEKGEVESGREDPAWRLPQSADGLNMSIDAATEFAQREGEAYIEANPDYYPCKKNFEAVTAYLSAQGVVIPTQDCFAQAVERLRHFGLLEERPTPAPEPVAPEQVEPDPEEVRQRRREEYRTKIIVTDPRTGESFTEYQLDRLSADDYKRLMIGEFSTPTVADVIRPTRSMA
jgi:hypothetical protein